MDDDIRDLVDEQRASNRKSGSGNSPRPGVATAVEIRRFRLHNADGTSRLTPAPDAYDRLVETTEGPVLSRVFPFPGGVGTVIHFHGGGWALGSIYEQDTLLSDLALAIGYDVISVDYPLAPESTLPNTLIVSMSAIRAILEKTEGPVCVMGESAGAHVALASILGLRRQIGTLAKIQALSLGYGIYDLSMTPSQRSWGEEFLGLSTPWLEWFYAQALPGVSRDQRSDPALSPLYSDLAGLPPVLLSVGGLDPLLDDSTFLQQRLMAAGTISELDYYPEAHHGFNHSGTRMARRCNQRVASFLRNHMTIQREL